MRANKRSNVLSFHCNTSHFGINSLRNCASIALPSINRRERYLETLTGALFRAI
jgi:hypothetical protein